MASFQDLIVMFRKQMADEDPPYLWDDDELLTYAIDAQDMLVRAYGGIIDMEGQNSITQLTVTANSPWSPYSPYVLRFRSGRLLTSQRDIAFGSEGELSRRYPYWDYGWSYPDASLLDDTYTGTTDSTVSGTQYGVLGMQDKSVRWYPVPTVSETCQCVVFRLPFPRPAATKDPLEVDSRHHIHLVKWMRHMAYLKQDSEAGDPKAAANYEEMFNIYCEKVRREVSRERFKPREVRSDWPTGARRAHF